MTEKKKTISVYPDEELLAEIEAFAKREMRPVAQAILFLAKKGLKSADHKHAA